MKRQNRHRQQSPHKRPLKAPSSTLRHSRAPYRESSVTSNSAHFLQAKPSSEALLWLLGTGPEDDEVWMFATFRPHPRSSTSVFMWSRMAWWPFDGHAAMQCPLIMSLPKGEGRVAEAGPFTPVVRQAQHGGEEGVPFMPLPNHPHHCSGPMIATCPASVRPRRDGSYMFSTIAAGCSKVPGATALTM